MGQRDMYISLRRKEMVIEYPEKSQQLVVRIEQIVGFGTQKVGKS